MYIFGRSMYYSSSIAQHSDAPKPFILMQKMKRRIVTSKDCWQGQWAQQFVLNFRWQFCIYSRILTFSTQEKGHFIGNNCASNIFLSQELRFFFQCLKCKKLSQNCHLNFNTTYCGGARFIYTIVKPTLHSEKVV